LIHESRSNFGLTYAPVLDLEERGR